MPTEPPPGRYRVVEKGRRLVVIDTTTGQAATRDATPAAQQGRLERASFDGRSTLTTHPFYDLKGPRTLDLDPGGTVLMKQVRVGIGIASVVIVVAVVFAPWLAVLPVFLLLQPVTRNGLRRRVTDWLDRYDADASTG